MKIVVIGGGASGLVSAIFSKTSKNEVIILERNNNCGKKILITGNGKCNYWNSDQSINHYHSTNFECLKELFTPKINNEVLNFFEKIGIVPKIKNRYYYPTSNQATSIQTALILEAKLKGIIINNNEYVKNITKKSNKYYIETEKNNYVADKVIIATGSKAVPKTGSDGSGYDFAIKLGHSIIKPLPALVQLNGIGNYFKEWAGVKQDVKVTLIENNFKLREEYGEINLTDYGLSGICVMQLSDQVAKGLDCGKDETVEINFMPWIINESDFIKWMDNRNKQVINRSVTELLDGVLNYKLVNLFIKKSKIKQDEKWENLSPNLKKILASYIICFKQKIISTNSFDKAQICSGGVPINEININTMESKISNNLYFVGEVLDVNGDCGGYNLGFAWISGIIAGKAISKEE